jgi:hypothetical protein
MTANSAAARPSISKEELVGFIIRSVVDHFQVTGRSLNGSLLASLVRKQFPDLSYPALGLGRLGDAVQLAISTKGVVRNQDVQHLELRPVEAQRTTAAVPELRRAPASLSVRADIWRAVAFVHQKEVAFYNRETKTLTEVDESNIPRLKQLRSDLKLVEVEKAGLSTQINWLESILAAKSPPLVCDRDQILKIIGGDSKNLETGLAREWKAVRSAKIIAHVKDWASKNRIAEGDVLVPHVRGQTKLTKGVDVVGAGSDQDLRRAILATIQEMSLAELESIAVPIRYVLRHFTIK